MLEAKTRTCKGNRTIDSEDSGEAADVTKLAVGIARENLSAIATKKLDSLRSSVGLHVLPHSCCFTPEFAKRKQKLRERGGERDLF